MITANDIAGALVKCETSRSYIDDSMLSDTIIDGYYDLVRAAKLLNRLQRQRVGTDASNLGLDGERVMIAPTPSWVSRGDT